MGDLALRVLGELIPGLSPGELSRDGRKLRWVEAGAGGPTVIFDAGLGEPGTLGWASAMAKVAPQSRAVAYDRAGLGMSEPASPLTLETSVGDLAALAAHVATDGCILVGHSWSGLLVQLAALRCPELIAGLVLVDPAEETYWESLPPEVHQQGDDDIAELLDKYSRGEHNELIRETFERNVRVLTDDPELAELIFQAYEASHELRSQVEAYPAEMRLFDSSISEIRELRAATPLPDVPVVVLSATQGAREDHRAAWTSLHARLAASVPRGQHIVLADTDHAINEAAPEAVVAAIESIRSAL